MSTVAAAAAALMAVLSSPLILDEISGLSLQNRQAGAEQVQGFAAITLSWCGSSWTTRRFSSPFGAPANIPASMPPPSRLSRMAPISKQAGRHYWSRSHASWIVGSAPCDAEQRTPVHVRPYTGTSVS
ncbi:hypothetical protein [Streptomyces flavofungini]|uniref:hypothetical protein n=1 Tax=Streptomyces flavofungini TaxID=68200 RepID=UPI0034DEB331